MLFEFHNNSRIKEFKIFPSLFGFEKPVLAISNLAHLLLPSLDADEIAKSKELTPFPFSIWCALRMFAHLLPVGQKRRPAAARYFNKNNVLKIP